MTRKKREKKGNKGLSPPTDKGVVVVVDKEDEKPKARKPAKLMEVFSMFENKSKKPFLEVPLLKFEEWADEFEFFSSFVNDDTKDFKVWLCDNSVPKQVKGYSSYLNSFSLGWTMSQDFLSKYIKPYGLSSIKHQEVGYDPFFVDKNAIIFMIMAMDKEERPSRSCVTSSPTKTSSTKSSAGSPKYHVIAAVYFNCMLHDPPDASNVRNCCNVFWMSVAEKLAFCNTLVLCYKGIGRFLLMLVIKYGDAKMGLKISKSVESTVFVNSVGDSVDFFEKVGFVSAKNSFADEYALFVSGCTKLVFPTKVVTELLILPSGSFGKKAAATSNPVWCSFPLKESCGITRNTLDLMMHDLRFLNEVCQARFTDSTLIAAECFPFTNEVLTDRMKLLKSDASTWLNNGELDVMLAF